MIDPAAEPDTAAAVLTAARSHRSAADAHEAELLQTAVSWAAMHSVDSLQDAASLSASGDWHGEAGVPVAGAGAPLIAEFCVADFAAAVNLSTDAGRSYLGEAVELRHRLPRTWARVVAGDLVAWKARRIAKLTFLLSAEAATFVDAQVAHCAHRIGPVQLDRLVQEAVARFMPEETERQRREAADGRHFTIANQVDALRGTTEVTGTLDLADALDLEDAVAAGAQQLRELGSAESLAVRRSLAVGVLARRQPTLDLTNSSTDSTDADGNEPSVSSVRGRRRMVLYVHLSDAALSGRSNVGRCENTASPVTVEQIRSWCATPDAAVLVKPVIDLNDHVRVDAYEVPDRLREAAALTDVTCVFPWCTRRARRCDCDHCHPHGEGGETATDNIAPLCRRHHRLKTHGGWRYVVIERGTYLWTNRYGYQWLRDHSGTTDVSRLDSHDGPDGGPDSPDDTGTRRRP